jgi:hypothetical protein
MGEIMSNKLYIVYNMEEPKLNGLVQAKNKKEAIDKHVWMLNRGERGIPYRKSDYDAVKVDFNFEKIEDLIDYLAYDLTKATEKEYAKRTRKLFALAVALRELWTECSECGRKISPFETIRIRWDETMVCEDCC